MNTTEPIIEVQDLTYTYGRAEAVHGLNLKVQAGAAMAYLAAMEPVKTTPSNAC